MVLIPAVSECETPVVSHDLQSFPYSALGKADVDLSRQQFLFRVFHFKIEDGDHLLSPRIVVALASPMDTGLIVGMRRPVEKLPRFSTERGLTRASAGDMERDLKKGARLATGRQSWQWPALPVVSRNQEYTRES